jgi:hypothetical protein
MIDGLTISEALAWLSPPIPRRTLQRRLAGSVVLGYRTTAEGGRPAPVYPADAVMRAHAEWVRSVAHGCRNDQVAHTMPTTELCPESGDTA